MMQEKMRVSYYVTESDETVGYIGGYEVENISWIDHKGNEADISGFIDSLPHNLSEKIWDYLASLGEGNNE